MSAHRFDHEHGDRCSHCGQPPDRATNDCFERFEILGVELVAMSTNWNREGVWRAEIPRVGQVMLVTSNPHGTIRYCVQLWVRPMAEWVTFPWATCPSAAVEAANIGIRALLKLGAEYGNGR